MAGGVLDFGGILAYRATVRKAEASGGLDRISVVAPARWGAEQIDAIEPWHDGYICAVPEVGTSVWVFELPDGTMRYAFNEPGAATTKEAATRWPPLRTILLAMLGNLDQLNSRTWSIPIGGVAVNPATHLNTAVITVVADPAAPEYGDARTDTEGDEPAAHTHLVTHMPKGTEDE